MDNIQKKTQKFIISYDAQSITDSHSMNVEDLAPALLALDRMFQISNNLLNDNIDTRLKIIGPQKGSVEIVLCLAQILPEIIPLLEVYTPTKLLNLFFKGKGLFDLIKKLSATKTDAKNKPVINQYITNNYKADVIKICNNSTIRKETKCVIKPLLNGEEERKMNILDKSRKILYSINTNDARKIDNFLEQTEQETDKDTSRYTKYYHIIKLNFEKEKWQLSDNNSTITVSIEDKGFMQKVKSSLLHFSKDDTLKCKMREEQKEINGKLKSYYFVEKVDHKPASKQISMFQSSPD